MDRNLPVGKERNEEMKKAILVLILVLVCIPALAEAAPVSMAPMQIDLTPIINAVIALIAGIVAYRVLPWVKARTTETQQTNILVMAKTLAFAAAQMLGESTGAEKLAWVEGEMEKRGYRVDIAVIEAAVKELKLEEAMAEQWVETEETNDGDDDSPGEQ